MVPAAVLGIFASAYGRDIGGRYVPVPPAGSLARVIPFTLLRGDIGSWYANVPIVLGPGATRQ
jgi:hypothetical protein